MTTTTFTDAADAIDRVITRSPSSSETAAPCPDKLAWVFFVITIVCCGGFIGGIIAYIF